MLSSLTKSTMQRRSSGGPGFEVDVEAEVDVPELGQSGVGSQRRWQVLGFAVDDKSDSCVVVVFVVVVPGSYKTSWVKMNVID